jgi:hypothetical protein
VLPLFTGVTALANAIPDMGALTKFDISKNNLIAEGGMLLAVGLKGNQVITELNIGSNALGFDPNGYADTSGVVAIADVIGDMGALTKFDISKCRLQAEGGKALAAGLSRPQRQLQRKAARLHRTRVCSSCGEWKKEGCFSKKQWKKVDRRCKACLDLSSAAPAVLHQQVLITELNISDNDLGMNSGYSADTSGIIAIANAIPDMKALIKLDISRNRIGAAQEGELQRICLASGIELAK